jgi:hypothetical protein
MSSRRSLNVAVAGLLAVAAAVSSAATAAADPPPPTPADPGVAPPPQGLSDFLAGPVTTILGQPAQGPGAPVDLLLGQYPVPSVPGEQPMPPMDLNTALSGNSYLLPQNYQLSPQGEGNLYSIAPGDVTGQPSLIPALKGAHSLWHGAMGRLTPDQLGEPLPGTAPPPGTNIPAGLNWPEPTPPTDLPVPPPGG